MSYFIEHLRNDIYVRLKPSSIHGVGVFAIRPIPAGINPLTETRAIDFGEINVTDVMDDSRIPQSVKQLVVDLCPQREDVFDIPPFSLNEIGVAWYMNHSPVPNMEEKDGDFFTKRDILDGEELTVDYGTYGALNL
jgi:hypothetical protein